MAKVNICVCVKNRQAAVEAALHSLVSQTYQDLKILTCDGKSQDSTMTTLYQCQVGTKSKVIAWMTEQEGYVNTHNFILSKIDNDCEYIGFVDSDDLVDEHKVEEQVKYLESHPDVDIVSSCVVFNDKRVLINTYVEVNNDQITEALKKGTPMSTLCHFQSCLFRRKCLDKFINKKFFYDEYDTGMAGEGFLYTLHYLGYKFANIPTTFYLYRRGIIQNSMSNNIVPEFANAIDSLSYENKMNYIKELFEKYNSLEEDKIEEVKEEDKIEEKVKEQKLVEKKTTKKTIKQKEEPKIEESKVEEAPKKRGRPKKTETK